jgi:hypothetical protein
LFPEVGSVERWLGDAGVLAGRERTQWAKAKRAEALAKRLEELQEALLPGVSLSADLRDGELRLLADGIPIIDKVFVREAEAEFIAIQWDMVARAFTVTDRSKARLLADRLRAVAPADNPTIVEQVLAAGRELRTMQDEIARKEREVDQIIYAAFRLTPDEIALIEQG